MTTSGIKLKEYHCLLDLKDAQRTLKIAGTSTQTRLFYSILSRNNFRLSDPNC